MKLYYICGRCLEGTLLYMLDVVIMVEWVKIKCGGNLRR
jgi:hypothetical protein